MTWRFENLIYSIADDNLIVYDVLLKNFREGSNLRKDDDLLISIGQLKNEGARFMIFLQGYVM